mmetsp:Transcript_5986/g.19257  ORF Transcript_5986/g.19257 Transcript_5986/m.19257 type:complete len:214 (-) Transcript_5986:374-1015(-)
MTTTGGRSSSSRASLMRKGRRSTSTTLKYKARCLRAPDAGVKATPERQRRQTASVFRRPAVRRRAGSRRLRARSRQCSPRTLSRRPSRDRTLWPLLWTRSRWRGRRTSRLPSLTRSRRSWPCPIAAPDRTAGQTTRAAPSTSSSGARPHVEGGAAGASFRARPPRLSASASSHRLSTRPRRTASSASSPWSRRRAGSLMALRPFSALRRGCLL